MNIPKYIKYTKKYKAVQRHKKVYLEIIPSEDCVCWSLMLPHSDIYLRVM